MVGRIMGGGDALSEFSGYANSEDATQKKIIRDVLGKGDYAFSSGVFVAFSLLKFVNVKRVCCCFKEKNTMFSKGNDDMAMYFYKTIFEDINFGNSLESMIDCVLLSSKWHFFLSLLI
jgi:hypothetical protein